MVIDGSIRYAGLGRRIASGLLDAALILFLAALVGLVLLVAGGGEGSAAGDGPAGDRGVVPQVLFASLLVMQCLSWWRLGGTPGMLALDCAVLDSRTGGRLTLSRSVLRCLVLWLGMLPLGVSMLWVLKDARRRGLHDLAARSVVAREDESLMSLEELEEQLT